jgi:hypothetical protein
VLNSRYFLQNSRLSYDGQLKYDISVYPADFIEMVLDLAMLQSVAAIDLSKQLDRKESVWGE